MNDNFVRGAWWFDHARAGTMQTSGLRSLLEGAHLTASEMFVREVTQNSVDAQFGTSGPVGMRFSSFVPSSEQSTALGGFLLGDGEISKRLSSFVGNEGFSDDGGFYGKPGLQTQQRSLLVEDFGTKGLGGEIGGTGPEDHFSRLVYFFGQSHGEGTTGGAFGFGKSVYSVASNVRTVVYYSKPASELPSRLIAVGLFPSHEFSGRRYIGYALCGISGRDPAFPIEPLVGEAADQLAHSLGMQVRDATEPGTSLLIVDCNYAVDDLRRALEKWWWPRLVTTGPHGLVTELVQDGRTVEPPDPMARPELEHFVRAYEHHLDGRQDTEETKSKQIRSTNRRPVGKLTLRRIQAENETGEEDEWFTRTVALFRGPRLVVEYAPFGRPHLPPFAGVFVADDEMDSVLRESENPAHDTWSPESGRLEEVDRPLVRAITKYGKQFSREFQESFVAKPVAGSSRFRELEDLLGRMFNKGQSAGPVPPGLERPISLSVKERRNEDAGFDEAQIVIESKDRLKPLPAIISVVAHVLGDARRNRVDMLEVELFDQDGLLRGSGTRAELAFVVPPDAPVRFVARTRSSQESAVVFEVEVSGSRS